MRSDLQGLVFDIQRFSIHDGPGIRTLVFMKGCPLRCSWCSNPESQQAKPEIMYFEEKCIHCGACLEACPYGEVLEENWPVATELCYGCGSCVEVCYAEARKLVGRWYTVEQVSDIVERDRVFYEESGGGMTVGGGEPMFQAAFVAGLLQTCRRRGIHTAIETCGFTPWKTMSKVLEHTDLLLMDIKHMDSQTHKKHTGVGNERILENARKAADVVGEMVVRLPLIPDFNDGHENIRALGRFVAEQLPAVQRIDVLPYHSTGESKSKRLGRPYTLPGLKPQSREKVDAVEQILQSYGIKIRIGG
ncbi:MAG: glycyl-radical enzyme activating protein [Spirochaetaceae bacterium]|nr:MAG: glycyl-radical enzyme activating protein [Spirochaetaceae bacterium]